MAGGDVAADVIERKRPQNAGRRKATDLFLVLMIS